MTVLALSMPPDSGAFGDPLKALALRAREGEGVAFTELYTRTRDQAYRVLYRVVGPTPELEDLVQESYAQLMRAIRTYRGDSKVSTFLHRVCMNVGLMHLRTQRRRPETPTDELPEQVAHEVGDPERAVKIRQAHRITRDALSQLTEDKAAVFAYHELMGLKPEEIAELVNCPVNTVRSRLHRAREDFTSAVTELTRSRA